MKDSAQHYAKNICTMTEKTTPDFIKENKEKVFTILSNFLDKIGYGNSDMIHNFLDSHSRTPLFTTEDGKEIFPGDKYWHISDKNTVRNDIASISHFPCPSNSFSTYTAAEDYLIKNARVFSLEDVGNFINLSEDWDKAEALAKSRLNIK